MPNTKKEVAEEAVKKVKAVAEDAKATVKAAAETVTEKAEATVVKAKTAAKKAAAKPRAAAKKTAAKKDAEKIETKVVVELPNVSESTDSLIERAKADWTAKGNALSNMKQLTLYINAVEGMVYYVVNDDYLSGNFAI
ncbi:MAG: hypothetical protein IK134_09055 [Oscillospiraceae bacterium]|nr:hypothetical protein [Oscillospiraceae bacterium]MBQ9905686.1 hypothetical protein [Oscillospiraceae bacterium]MBR5363453.1 hypothetical protein [Oscillospiraceae bacterium]